MIFERFGLRARLFLTISLVSVGTVMIAGSAVDQRVQDLLLDRDARAISAWHDLKRREIESYFDRRMNMLVDVTDHRAFRDHIALVARVASRQPERHLTLVSPLIPAISRVYLSQVLLGTPFERMWLLDENADRLLLRVDGASASPGDDNENDNSTALRLARSLVNSGEGTERVMLAGLDPRVGPTPLSPMFAGLIFPVIDTADRPLRIVVQLNHSETSSLFLRSAEWHLDELGTSAETFIVGPDNITRTTSRFFEDSPEDFLTRLSRSGVDSRVIDRIRQAGYTAGLLPIETKPITLARGGVTDARVVTDYRGVRVLEAFGPMRFHGLDWVIASKVDIDELVAPWHRLRILALLISVMVASIFALVGFGLASRITRPLLDLTRLAESFGRGSLERRAVESGSPEIRGLARSLNRMADSLRDQSRRLERKRAIQKQLEGRLVEVAELERQRIGRDLHDGLAQHLAATAQFLRLAQSGSTPRTPEDAARLERVATLLDTGVAMTREISRGLSPVGHGPKALHDALRVLAREVEHVYRIPCLVESDERLGVESELVASKLFRIAQESAQNAAKHASPTNIRITLGPLGRPNGGPSDGLFLEVADNGSGFDPDQSIGDEHMGLRFMRARADAVGINLEIDSAPGRGTRVLCRYYPNPQRPVDKETPSEQPA